MPSFVLIFLLLTLPWLNPFSSGPAPSALPLLFSWLCAGLLLMVWGWLSHQRSGARLVTVVALAWLAAALLSAGMGVLQYFGATALLGSWVNATALGEAFGNLRQRNQFATLLNIGLMALLWCAARTPISLSGRSWLALAAAALLGVGNAASSSRTGLMQLLLLLLLLLWIWGGWREAAQRRVLLAAALAYALASLLLPLLAGLGLGGSGILARLHEQAPACTSRLTLWRNVLHLIGEKPWLGWGWGELDYAHFITPYPGTRFCDILDNAHNLPLHLAVELGLPLAVSLCALAAWSLWRAQPWRERDPSRQMAWGVLALLALHSLLEYPLWYGPFQMAALLCVWLLVRAPTRSFAQYESFRPFNAVIYSALAMILIASSAYAAWDYRRISQVYIAPELRVLAYQERTLEKLQASWLFRPQVQFATLSTTPLERRNAAQLHDLAAELLHFSPEPRVIEVLINSALLLGRDDEAGFYLLRYRLAFPEAHARWLHASAH